MNEAWDLVFSSISTTVSISSSVRISASTGNTDLLGIFETSFWPSTVASIWLGHTVNLLLLWDMEGVYRIFFVWIHEEVALNDGTGRKCPAGTTPSLISDGCNNSFIDPIDRHWFLETSFSSMGMIPLMVSVGSRISWSELCIEIKSFVFTWCEIWELANGTCKSSWWVHVLSLNSNTVFLVDSSSIGLMFRCGVIFAISEFVLLEGCLAHIKVLVGPNVSLVVVVGSNKVRWS